MRKIIVCIFMCFCVSAFAQRTTPMTVFADLRGGTNFYSWAAGVQVGLYDKWGYYYVSGEFSVLPVVSQKGSKYSYAPAVADIGAMYRFARTRSRSLNAYIGGGAILGAEIADVFGKLPEAERLVKTTRFIYGLRPKAELEWYFCNMFGLNLEVGMPVYVNSQVRNVACDVLLGLRYNF